jgi:putative transposase
MNFNPVFSLGNQYNNILIDSLKYQINEHKANLYSYVIMHHHIHLIIYLPEGESLIDFMRDFKKFTSTQIRKQLEADNNIDQINKLRINSKGYKNQVFKLWMDRYG